jgi:FlaA1/EpsC-like NDP-sugar epimerase
MSYSTFWLVLFYCFYEPEFENFSTGISFFILGIVLSTDFYVPLSSVFGSNLLWYYNIVSILIYAWSLYSNIWESLSSNGSMVTFISIYFIRFMNRSSSPFLTSTLSKSYVFFLILLVILYTKQIGIS